jgi:CheY-like chemotaxis protein
LEVKASIKLGREAITTISSLSPPFKTSYSGFLKVANYREPRPYGDRLPVLAWYDLDANVISSPDAGTIPTERFITTMTNALILLLVSDSVGRVVIEEALEHGGYAVMAAGDLGTAVKRVSESKPDLLIISPYIEDISGYDTAKFLRTKCHGVPVLMVAGLIDDQRLEYRLELEGFEVFPKPYSAAELLWKVKGMLSRS